jgi:hypothetical protein
MNVPWCYITHILPVMLYLLVFVCSFFSLYSSITNTTVIQISIIICCFIAITSNTNTIIYFTIINSCFCMSFFFRLLVSQFSFQNLLKLCTIFCDKSRLWQVKSWYCFIYTITFISFTFFSISVHTESLSTFSFESEHILVHGNHTMYKQLATILWW